MGARSPCSLRRVPFWKCHLEPAGAVDIAQKTSDAVDVPVTERTTAEAAVVSLLDSVLPSLQKALCSLNTTRKTRIPHATIPQS